MGRYIRKVTQLGSFGPTEERRPGLWIGYDIAGVDDDLSEHGLLRVDGWPDERLAEYGVTMFTRVDRDEKMTYGKLGIRGSHEAG